MIFKKLKKGFSALKDVTKKAITNIVAYQRIKAKEREIKKLILNRFTVRQLDEIAARQGISWSYTDPLTGEKIVFRTKRDKVRRLASRLPLETIILYARRYKVKYRDLLDELEKFKAQVEAEKKKVELEPKYAKLIEALREFEPEPIRDEYDLEKQLYQFLKAKGFNLKRQAKIGGGLTVDMLFGKLGIELKVPTQRTHLQRLIGQVEDYLKRLDHLIVLILNTGKVKNLDEYIEELEKHGAIPLIYEGELRKR